MFDMFLSYRHRLTEYSYRVQSRPATYNRAQEYGNECKLGYAPGGNTTFSALHIATTPPRLVDPCGLLVVAQQLQHRMFHAATVGLLQQLRVPVVEVETETDILLSRTW